MNISRYSVCIHAHRWFHGRPLRHRPDPTRCVSSPFLVAPAARTARYVSMNLARTASFWVCSQYFSPRRTCTSNRSAVITSRLRLNSPRLSQLPLLPGQQHRTHACVQRRTRASKDLAHRISIAQGEGWHGEGCEALRAWASRMMRWASVRRLGGVWNRASER